MEKIRQGAIAVLTHKENVVFLPLPEEDIAPLNNGGKEKKERARGDEEWTVLQQGMLGFVSGGVKTDEDLGLMQKPDQETIVFETIRREADEEFGLPVNLDKSEIVRDGIIEQVRYGEAMTFLLWVVTRVVIEENNLLKLKERVDVVEVPVDQLKDFLASEKKSIRPAAQQAVLSAYKL
jgi:8-oxo-dGTP pyrophosphatase MutT (NUDIX family)